jgi:aminotransferase
MDTLDFILQTTIKNKDNVFLIDGESGEEITYKDFHDQSCHFAKYFKSLGLTVGDRIIILLNNSVPLAKLYFGCLYSGITVVPINPVLSKVEIDFILDSYKAKMIISSPDLKDKIDSERLDKLSIKYLNLVEDKPGSTKTEDNLLNLISSVEGIEFKPFQNVVAKDDLIIIHTSGTTGTPKGIIQSYFSLIENGRLFCKHLNLGVENRFYNLLSMTYLGGYYNLMLIPFICGGSLVIGQSFNPNTMTSFWDLIIDRKVNTLWLVPSIMAMVMELDRGSKGEKYSKAEINYTICGTAPLPEPLKADYENRYGTVVYENFGLSETFFISSNTPQKDNNHGVGSLLEGVAIKIIDKSGQPCKKGVEGEIVVQTPHLLNSYCNVDDEITKTFNKGDWFSTGDVGKITDEHNQLHITGRIKDLIIRGGINISPASIENILYQNPKVIECAVVGVPHQLMGEEIIAVIRTDGSIPFGDVKDELKAYCKNNLPIIKQPYEYHELEEFPHTYSGKIQKSKLRAWIIKNIEKKDVNNYTDISKTRSSGIDKKSYYRASQVTTNSIQALSITYNNIVYEMKQAGTDVIVLSLGEAFFDIPLFPFDDLPFPDLYHYSHSRGTIDLREKLAQYFRMQYDVDFNPLSEIIVTAGSKIAIHMSLMAILNPGDEVIFHEPAWVSYPEQIKLCYGVPVRVPYDEAVYDFEKYITNRTKAIIINSPCNPSGKVYSIDELSYLYKIAERYNLFILSDEAYSDFILDEDQFISMGNLDPKKDHTIICNSISKNYGISGWRLGYVIANEHLIEQILKINQHLVTCPATILEHYISKHFFEIIEITKPQIKDVVVKRRDIATYMDSIGLEYLQGTATFYFFVSIGGSKLGSEELSMRLLENDHISVVPGIGYGDSCDRFVRIGVGSESVDRIKTALDKLKTMIELTS